MSQIAEHDHGCARAKAHLVASTSFEELPILYVVVFDEPGVAGIGTEEGHVVADVLVFVKEIHLAVPPIDSRVQPVKGDACPPLFDEVTRANCRLAVAQVNADVVRPSEKVELLWSHCESRIDSVEVDTRQ